MQCWLAFTALPAKMENCRVILIACIFLTIGVFKSKGTIIALPITEIISKNEFFDFQAKYEGASEEITPAKVDEAVAEKVRDEAKKAYAVFNCNGIVRMDFIYQETDGFPY